MSNTPVASNKKRLMITLPTELTEQMDIMARCACDSEPVQCGGDSSSAKTVGHI